MAKPTPTPIPVESGAAPTEQRETSRSAVADAVDAVEEQTAKKEPVSVMLSAPELAEIRRRNEDVDALTAEARTARDDANRRARTAAYAQADLTNFLRGIAAANGLDPTVNYTIDMDRGQIVPVR